MKLKGFGVMLVVLVAAFGVACGGGDSGGTTTTDAVTVDNVATEGDVTPQPDQAASEHGVQDQGGPSESGQEVTTTDQGTETPSTSETTEETAEACTKQCADKECGPDGCGGVCGSCPQGQFCNASGKCEVSQCKLPETWGPVGAIATASIPSNATGCPHNANDLVFIAGMANPEIQKAIDKGQMGIMLEFQGVSDFNNTASFTLAGLLGEPTAQGGTEFLVDPRSYKAEDCLPLISFEDASISNGLLAAGPSEFYLNLPIPQLGGNLEMTLKEAEITAKIQDGAVTAKDGFIGGYALKEDLDPIFQNLKDQCNTDKSKPWCQYAQYFDMINMFYKDYTIGGVKKKALAVCLSFTLKGATIKGYKDVSSD